MLPRGRIKGGARSEQWGDAGMGRLNCMLLLTNIMNDDKLMLRREH